MENAPCSEWLEGHISVSAALSSPFRDVEHILVTQDALRRSRDIGRLRHRALSQGISVEFITEDELSQRATGKSHGGIIAAVGPRRFVELGDLLAGHKRPVIVMLDGIEDPFNFGFAVRSLYAAGVEGLVVRPRNWLHASSVVARASAGATELMPTAIAESAEAAAAYFREKGLVVSCTGKSERSTSLFEADLRRGGFLLIGGEKRGVTRSFMQNADLVLEIPYGRQVAFSLSADSAAAVIGFEIARQRRYSP